MLLIEGSGGSELPYLGCVETHLKVPEVKAFDTDILSLIVPDSVHTTHRHGDQFSHENRVRESKQMKE